MVRWILALVSLISLGPIAIAQELPSKSELLEVFWSRPLSARQSGKKTYPGPRLDDVTVASTGEIFALAWGDRTQLLWSGLNESGPGKVQPLNMVGFAAKIALGTDGSIWLGGNTPMRSITPWRIGFPYVARFDPNGKKLFEKIYDDRASANSVLWDLAALPSGDLAIVGYEDNLREYTTWIRKIGHAGQVIWDRRLSLGSSRGGGELGSAVGVLADGTIVMLALEAVGHRPNYREQLILLLFTDTGSLIRRVPIREELHRGNPIGFSPETIAVVTAEDNIYVLSNSTNRPGLTPPPGLVAQPIEVTKISTTGTIFWTTRLPSAAPNAAFACGATMARTASGSLAIACASKGDISIYHLDEQNGEAIRTVAPLPECGRGAERVFVLAKPDARIDLLGTLARSADGDGCTWFGRIITPR
jgi:hypothetical protein